jgi:hypothetical protein
MPAANWPSWYGGHRTKQESGASQDGFIRWMAAARSRSSHVRRQDTHRQPIQARRRPERWSPRLSWPIRILHRPERQCPLYGSSVHRFCIHSPWHAPLSPRLLQRFRLPEGNGVSEHWFSARHSESEDRRFRFAQPLPQDVHHFGERGWLATASSRLAGCRRPSIGLEQASASQNDICTRRLRAMRSSGAEISASISFAQTWPATFDLNSRRTVNVRPLTS